MQYSLEKGWFFFFGKDFRMQAKGMLLKISTLNYIHSVLILGAMLSKISDTSQMMQEQNSMCILLLRGSKEFENPLKKISDHIYQTSVTDVKRIAESTI